MSVTKTYIGGKAMRFYINWNGKEYLVMQVTWYTDGKIMQVTFYDEEHYLRTIYHRDYDIESNIYTKNVSVGAETRKEKTI